MWCRVRVYPEAGARPSSWSSLATALRTVRHIVRLLSPVRRGWLMVAPRHRDSADMPAVSSGNFVGSAGPLSSLRFVTRVRASQVPADTGGFGVVGPRSAERSPRLGFDQISARH